MKKLLLTIDNDIYSDLQIYKAIKEFTSISKAINHILKDKLDKDFKNNIKNILLANFITKG